MSVSTIKKRPARKSGRLRKRRYHHARIEELRRRWFELFVGYEQMRLTAEDPRFRGINLASLDWGFACYMAKRGEKSELIKMLCGGADMHGHPPERAKRIIATILLRGKYDCRRGVIFSSDIPEIRALNDDLKLTIKSEKARIFRIARYYGVGESTVRDVIDGKRDFAGM